MRTTFLVFLLAFGMSAWIGRLKAQESHLQKIILKKLVDDAGATPRYAIEFEETNVIYQLPGRAFLASKGGTDSFAGGREPERTAGSRTNIVRAEFICWPGGGQIIRDVFDDKDTRVHKTGAYFGDGILLSYNQRISSNAVDTLKSGWGEVNIRERADYSGAPVFLSKSTLLNFLTNSSHLAFAEVMEDGAAFYTLKVASAFPGPVKAYRLYFETNNLEPVALCSYLDDGTLFSRTKLDFKEMNETSRTGRFACKTAESTVYELGTIRSKSLWKLKAFKPDFSAHEGAVSEFFPERTRVVDNRHGRPLSYHMGNRMPTTAELKLMVDTTNGVALYEAATSRLLPGDTLSQSHTLTKRNRKVVLGVLAVSALLPPFFLLVKRFFRRRA